MMLLQWPALAIHAFTTALGVVCPALMFSAAALQV
jgi:hypothetical protein